MRKLVSGSNQFRRRSGFYERFPDARGPVVLEPLSVAAAVDDVGERFVGEIELFAQEMDGVFHVVE